MDLVAVAMGVAAFALLIALIKGIDKI